jgi:photosystem II stability/assembly factor-like uncharacterized protein
MLDRNHRPHLEGVILMTTRVFSRRWLSGIGVILVGLLAAARLRAPIEPSLLAGLQWRNVGPFRAGRVSAVTGAVGQPGVFYMGMVLGGVWKTTSAGTTWYPVFDSIKDISSIGSVEVAPSDPNIVYVGTGSTGGGNGMYKSIDAGTTWQHLPGLEDTRQIPNILVDPKDPNLVMVAVLGNAQVANDGRGVYRSTDGGRTWKKTLYVDSLTGVQNIVRAFDRPNVVLATTIQRGGARGGGAGGAGAGVPPAAGRGGTGGTAPPTRTKLFKSVDEGVTWTEITGGGLPALTGRLTAAVAMNTNAQRMYVIGPVGFGLYRSDDGGTSWRRMAADDDRIANGQGNYTSGVFVNSKNPDIIYTIATCTFVSTDGGSHFTGFHCSPGGDDPQVMWIDPTDGKRLFFGYDQGGTISQDGGLAWSSWYNQPTAQIYHIGVDNSWPYWIYGSQQDACAVAVRSRGELGAVTMLDWYPTPAYEDGFVAPDPLNANILYMVGSTAGIVKVTKPTNQWVDVSPNVDTSLGLRRTGDQPMIFSRSNPHELLLGFQYLYSTTDGAVNWKRISPDLGLPEGVTPPARGVPPPPAGGGRGGGRAAGGTINAITTSNVAPGVIWVGMSNGLVKVTKNHGLTWDDASIPDVGPIAGAVRGSGVSAIDASYQDPRAAYVAINRGIADNTPALYRTHDYGKTWTKIVNGLPSNQVSGSYSRVVRADPKKAGLLFAGTESAMYVSFDDGDNWQSLMLNLPNTSYRDIIVKDNDLVVATYGRSIWILDDFSPLRQMTPAIASEPVHLFRPGDAIRVRRNINTDTPFPPEIPHADNPPLGAVIYYNLSVPAKHIDLDVMDAAGKLVRHFSSDPIPPVNEPPPPVPDMWVYLPKPLPTDVGMHRITWNIRYDDPPALIHYMAHVTGAVVGDTPWGPEGPLALPGGYALKLTVDGNAYTQTVTVTRDPSSPVSVADVQAEHELQMKLYEGTKETWAGYQQVTAVRAAVADVMRGTLPAEVAAAAAAFDSALMRVGGTGSPPVGRGGGGGGRGGAGPAAPPNFTTLNGVEAEEGAVLVSLNGQLKVMDSGDMAPNPSKLAAWRQVCADLWGALTRWQTINMKDLVAFNAVLAKNNIKPIAAASPMLPVPVCVNAPPSRRGRGN